MSEHRFINQTLTVTGLIGLALGGLVGLCVFITPPQRGNTSAATDRAPASVVAGKSSGIQENAGKYEKLNIGCEKLTRYSLSSSVERVMIVAQKCNKMAQQLRVSSDELDNDSKQLASAVASIKNTTTEIEASVFNLEDDHLSSDLVTLTAGVNRIEIVQDTSTSASRFIEITRLP